MWARLVRRALASLTWAARDAALVLLGDDARRVTVHLDNAKARYVPSSPDISGPADRG